METATLLTNHGVSRRCMGRGAHGFWPPGRDFLFVAAKITKFLNISKLYAFFSTFFLPEVYFGGWRARGGKAPRTAHPGKGIRR